MVDTHTVPGIVSDIDGVLLKQINPIPRSANGIRFLKKSLEEIDPEKFSGVKELLPFVCLTNSGTGTEKYKAETISKILGIEEAHERLNAHDIIMNFTPLREVFKEYKDKLVMLGGLGPLEHMAEDFGLNKFITDEEYCAMFPILIPYAERPKDGEEFERVREKVAARLGITNKAELDEPLQVHAIFMLNDPVKWDQRVQIICDLLSTSDGKVAHKFPLVGPEDHIPVYCTNDDLQFASDFRLPRMTFGCFNETLKSIYKKIYKRDLQLKMYGKPQKVTFDFAKKYLQESTKLQISKLYMIGDNPKSDIRGANAAGMTTILVKSGVFQLVEGYDNDHEDPADYIVEDFVDAIKLILKLEGIECDLE